MTTAIIGIGNIDGAIARHLAVGRSESGAVGPETPTRHGSSQRRSGRMQLQQSTTAEVVERADAVALALWLGSATTSSFWHWWSGRRDSNPRHPAWKASALPTELLPRQRSS